MNNNLLSDDLDPIETKEWLEALASVIKHEGRARALFLLRQINEKASQLNLVAATSLSTPYINTIPAVSEEKMPEDGVMLEKLTNILRWNALAMVLKAGKKYPEVGGHLSSYASLATLLEIGLNFFFRANGSEKEGDLIYYQGHASPGIYARAFLEDRLTAEHLDHFRQEAFNKKSVSSYPHPWLMPTFWQFPTVSMGLGPLMAIYQARFLKYLQNRLLRDTQGRKVWAFCGDGEMGEPESLGAINIAGREQLDNLIFVINCNLQRLDGPVWGNGQIIQEYESIFRGAGWNVIKVIWGKGWDELFARDKKGLLKKRISELVDGEYQNYSSKDGAYLREKFFGKYPDLLDLVADMTDAQLKELSDGGHDAQKVYAAYSAAIRHTGQPTVILAKTVKGYGLGAAGEGLNIAHNAKKMADDLVISFRNRFELPLSDQQAQKLEYLHPGKNSEEIKYLHEHRRKLNGFLPARETPSLPLTVPELSAFNSQFEGTEDRAISTTMAYGRILAILLKDSNIKDRIVPILADETRTFGLEGLFRQIGIYSPVGQKYLPEDKHLLMYYREETNGQLLQEGISEAGAMSSWIAAATSYTTNRFPMIPFYIYYSMFGFQRFGDLVWAAADSRARGFILGGTAGRTTLAGEGLQHQDGHNLLMFSFVPNCISYDPTFNYELAVIIQDGLRRMVQEQQDIFYYITLMNENYAHPPMPKGVEQGIIKGMYLFNSTEKKAKQRVRLLGSGAIFREIIKAGDILAKDYNIGADIYGVTSFNELHRDLIEVERHNRLHPDAVKKTYVEQCLGDNANIPVIAATDYIRLFADQIRSAVHAPYIVLGTDGFGRSDTRTALRDFFEVDAKMIVYSALKALTDQGDFKNNDLTAAVQKLGIDLARPLPTTV
ncbi:MAG: pyruvate dehydrogenase (acetyl-transferring), homodimeric type [Proteobacteria bacterium]|nr:pyruvate dehydrogenase (acetyl-transferring), homodimeric type [Pseudomonadota bacterium]